MITTRIGLYTPCITQFERPPYSITSYSVNSGLIEWIKTTYSRIEIKLYINWGLVRWIRSWERIDTPFGLSF